MHSNATSAEDESSDAVSASMLATARNPGQNGANAQLRKRIVAPRKRGGSLVSNSIGERVFCIRIFARIAKTRRPAKVARRKQKPNRKKNGGQ